MLGAPYHKSTITGPKTLFNLLRCETIGPPVPNPDDHVVIY